MSAMTPARGAALRVIAVLALLATALIGQAPAQATEPIPTVAATSPDPTFGASETRSCTLIDEGELSCWGATRGPVPGSWSAISLGRYSNTCALDVAGRPTCWGDQVPTAPDETFTSIDLGDQDACGLRPDHTLVCWGWGGEVPDGTFTAVSMDASGSCALRTTERVACWSNSFPFRVHPRGKFAMFSVGDQIGCGIRLSGELVCDGRRSPATRPPSGTFVDVSMAAEYGCGVRDSGALVCWGGLYHPVPPGGTYTAVHASESNHACAKTTAGEIVCFGSGYAEDYGAIRPRLVDHGVTAYRNRELRFQPRTTGIFPAMESWRVSQGTLPKGLSLDPASGMITGVPKAQPGNYYVRLSADHVVAPSMLDEPLTIDIRTP